MLKLLKDINSGSSSSHTPTHSLSAIGQTLFFTADNGVNGPELWRSDGTENGTYMVKDINLANEQSSESQFFIAIESIIYFSANDGETGEELWKTDGTADGTVL